MLRDSQGALLLFLCQRETAMFGTRSGRASQILHTQFV